MELINNRENTELGLHLMKINAKRVLSNKIPQLIFYTAMDKILLF